MTPERIRRACEGDDEGLDQLLQELLPVIRAEVEACLRRRARPHGRDARQDVDDFVHDVLVFLLADGGRNLCRWDPARGRSLSSFVRLVTRHRIARILEGFRGNPWGTDKLDAQPLSEIDPPARGSFVHQLVSREQLAHILEQLRARLNPRGMLLFDLLHVQQRPIAEVCELMSMTGPAVHQWNVRLRRLVRQLAEEDR